MFKWLENKAERTFRDRIRASIIAAVPNFAEMEGVLPHSTVETAYKTAWLHFGKPNLSKHPSIYRDACADACTYVVEYYSTVMELVSGSDERDG